MASAAAVPDVKQRRGLRATARVGGLVPWLVCLGSGCALLEPPRKAEAQLQPVIRLEVTAPPPLQELLARNLALGRVNRLARGEPLHEGELDRLVAAAPQQARELLDTEGYSNAEVRILSEKLGGETVATIPDITLKDIKKQEI